MSDRLDQAAGEPLTEEEVALLDEVKARAAAVVAEDAARYRHLLALAARLPGQPPSVRGVLAAKLRAGLGRLQPGAALPARQPVHVSTQEEAARRERAQAAAQRSGHAPRAGLAALVELNRDLRASSADDEAGEGDLIDAALARRGDGAPGVNAAAAHRTSRGRPPEMKSVRRFGATWARLAAERQVEQALSRGPQNAGPLNSHRLMLRSLALMRDLSPHYLGHFLAQADALLWLDQIGQQYSLAEGKSTRKPRNRK